METVARLSLTPREDETQKPTGEPLGERVRACACVGTFRGRKRRCRRTPSSPRQTRLPRPQRPGHARCGRRSSGLLLTKVTLWMEHESGESLQRETRTAKAAASTRTSGGTDTGELERWEGVSREEPGHSPVCLRQGGSREAPRPPAPLTRPLRPLSSSIALNNSSWIACFRDYTVI